MKVVSTAVELHQRVEGAAQGRPFGRGGGGGWRTPRATVWPCATWLGSGLG